MQKFQFNSSVRYIVSSTNIKRTFLSSELLPDGISKNVFYGNHVSQGTSLLMSFMTVGGGENLKGTKEVDTSFAIYVCSAQSHFY